MNKSVIKKGQLYTFSKSGNKVRAVAPATPYEGQACWTVERTEGQSAGKQMTVPAHALS